MAAIYKPFAIWFPSTSLGQVRAGKHMIDAHYVIIGRTPLMILFEEFGIFLGSVALHILSFLKSNHKRVYVIVGY